MSEETNKTSLGWTFDTLLHHLTTKGASFEREVMVHVESLRRENDDRDRLLVQIMDERRDAQERAVDVRTAQLDKEFHEHMSQYRHETDVVLAANDKAITKAENATDKEIASHTRATDQKFTALETKVSDLTDRLNLTQGERTGFRTTGGMIAGGIAAVASLVAVVSMLFAFTSR